ncbi:MAG: sensor histidine kinase [Sphingomonadaceae bacterium]
MIFISLACLLLAGALLYLYRKKHCPCPCASRLDEVRLRERERERARIARILHDNFLQQCQMTILMLDNLAGKIQLSASDLADLERIARNADEAMTQGRDLILLLRQTELRARLRERLEVLGSSLQRLQPLDFECRLQSAAGNASDAFADELFVLLAEAVRNAFKHAMASHISVTDYLFPTEIEITVADDGIGIPPAFLRDTRPDGHYGLTGMQERAALLGAVLAIASSTGGGTRVTLRFSRARYP